MIEDISDGILQNKAKGYSKDGLMRKEGILKWFSDCKRHHYKDRNQYKNEMDEAEIDLALANIGDIQNRVVTCGDLEDYIRKLMIGLVPPGNPR